MQNDNYYHSKIYTMSTSNIYIYIYTYIYIYMCVCVCVCVCECECVFVCVFARAYYSFWSHFFKHVLIHNH